MAIDDTIQLVTFNLGKEQYGIDIMQVEGIVREHEIRNIPNAPSFVEGIFNLRGEILPVINLHKRFHLEKIKKDESDDLLSGLIIIKVNKMKLAVKIDKVAKVITINKNKIQPPPQMIKGIGSEYIEGVTPLEDQYIIILDIDRLFALKELQQLESLK
ncbi:MAG: chemotaxis protein CheW [Spirochaetia bacterium]|jgi:purine-binding chemotaxis protein CheW|nr:chemotaxis protein CheW [Spirochaetia bacterium]